MTRQERVGEYQKGRRRITEPVMRVDPSRITPAKLAPEVLEEVKDYLGIPKGGAAFWLSKSQGWAFAFFMVTIASTLSTVGYMVLKREHEIKMLHQEVAALQQWVDIFRAENQELERKLVEQDTQIENLKDHATRLDY